jgi:hypothetical protein
MENIDSGLNMKIRLLAAAVLAALSVGAHATTVFSDNFDSDAQGLNVVPAGWTVTGGGTVDIIGTGFFDEIPGNGNYVDLDGSNGAAGLLGTLINVAPGGYTASFQLGGNHRDGTTDLVTVTFGGVTSVIAVGPTDAFTTYSVTTTSAGGDLSLSFQDGRGGDVGALLDNVAVMTAVPEPANATLMLAGLLALGFAARRRRG